MTALQHPDVKLRSSFPAPISSAKLPLQHRLTGTHHALNDEHDAYEWVSFEEANDMLSFPGQRRALEAVKAEFID